VPQDREAVGGDARELSIGQLDSLPRLEAPVCQRRPSVLELVNAPTVPQSFKDNDHGRVHEGNDHAKSRHLGYQSILIQVEDRRCRNARLRTGE
jgi:hypothetical protein